jgi:hypothetical protein
MRKIFATFKTTKIQKAAIMIACIGFFGILIYMKVEPDLPVFLKKDVIMTETIAEDGGAIIEVEESLSAIEGEFPLTMSDYQIADAIHAMSHQKVISVDDEKWGAKIPLTQERVKRLLEVVEVRQHDLEFENESLYFEILNRWADNDFSQVARDHNHIWYNQGGTIGEATGIMSHDDEMDYIKANFDVNE